MRPLLILIFSIFCFLSNAQFRVRQGAATLRVSTTGQTFKAGTPVVIYTYELTEELTVSAGIFKEDSTLVRVLLNNVRQPAGVYNLLWDGTDEDSVVVPVGNYVIKTLTNNITATWQGVIGNSIKRSAKWNQPGRLNFGNSFAVNSSSVYMSGGYQEQHQTAYRFALNRLDSLIPILDKGAITEGVTADDTHVYWSVNYYGDVWTFVTNVSDDQEPVLEHSQGHVFSNIWDYKSAFNVYINRSEAKTTGQAVQRSGSFYFSSHAGLDTLKVFDKSTLELVNSVYLDNPTALAVDNSNHLYAVVNNVIKKFQVDGDGSLTELLTITDYEHPVALAVDNDGNLLVSDYTTQQVHKYVNDVYVSSFGDLGGYQNPIANDHKFYFHDERYGYAANLAFANDGSIFIFDGGNDRIQHYDRDFNFLNRITWQIHFYSSTMVKGDSSRVFAGFREFHTDYSKLASDESGSYLAANWGYKITQDKDDEFFRLTNVVKLSNNKTYALTGTNTTSYLVELEPSTGIRYTGQTYPKNTQLYTDGLYTMSIGGVGSPLITSRKLLTGFDGSNNPIFGASTTLQTIETTTNQDPIFISNLGTLTTGEITSNGVQIIYNASTTGYSDYLGFHATADPSQPGTGYHLGGIKNNKWYFKTSHITYPQYYGAFPEDGSFDVGNDVGPYSGSKALVSGRYVAEGFHGEFRRGGQTNYWNIRLDNGLILKQFGTERTQDDGFDYQPDGMAGNSYAASFVQVNGSLYLFHNDEGTHSGIHRWKLSGLNTIKEKTIPITVSFQRRNERGELTGIDLMAGLPYNDTLRNNSFGWTRSPAIENYSNRFGGYWSIRTNKRSFKKREACDLHINYFLQPGEHTVVTRSLGTNTGLATWEISGLVNYEYNSYNPSIPMPLEVVDNAGKVLVSFEINQPFEDSCKATVNNFRVTASPFQLGIAARARKEYLPIKIKMVGGIATVTLANYSPVSVASFESGGQMGNPSFLRVRINNYHSNSQEKVIDLKAFRFKPL